MTETLKTKIEALLVRIDSANTTELADLKEVLQSLLEQQAPALGSKNLDTLYNNALTYIADFADTIAPAAQKILQLLIWAIEIEFLSPSSGAHFPPRKPDEDNGPAGGYFGNNAQESGNHGGIMLSGNNTNLSYEHDKIYD